MIAEKVISPDIAGYLIFCFKELREVALIELRQGFNQEYDNVLNFYLDKMNSSVYSRNIDLKKYEEIQKLAKQYVEYEVHYSFSDLYEIKNELVDCQYSYVLISRVPNVIKDYNLSKFDLYERNKTGNFIKIQEIKDFLEVYLENYNDLELGSLENLTKNLSTEA
jgi:hypothetical protein